MCQKASGGFFGAFVGGHGLEWMRGAPAYFQSSNSVRRGFCSACGTPLSFEKAGCPAEISIGAFDHPAAIPPKVQLSVETKLLFFDSLHDLPVKASDWSDIVSNQHPDHDTETWPHDR